MLLNNSMQFITKNCFEWCKQESVNIKTNLVFNEYILLLMALFFFFGYDIIKKYDGIILSKFNVYEETLYKIKDGSFWMGFFIILIFIIYKIWFN